MICCQFRNTLIVPNSIHEVVLVILYVWAEEVNFYLKKIVFIIKYSIMVRVWLLVKRVIYFSFYKMEVSDKIHIFLKKP